MPKLLKSLLSWSSSAAVGDCEPPAAQLVQEVVAAEAAGQQEPERRPEAHEAEEPRTEEPQQQQQDLQVALVADVKAKRPSLACVACEAQRVAELAGKEQEEEPPTLSTSFLRRMDTLGRSGLDRLWSSSSASSKCFLCARVFCTRHCEAFALPYGVLPEQMGQPFVCQDCLPEAKTLRDMELETILERRRAQAEQQRVLTVRNGRDCERPENCRQCIECPAKADMYCPVCGVALCKRHVVCHATSSGSRAPQRLKACGACESVLKARAEARTAVRSALAGVFRGSLAARHLGFSLAVADVDLVPGLEEAEDCAACGSLFSKLPGSLRHHCRGCGRSLCAACLCGKTGCLAHGPRCPHKARLPVYGIAKEERVCHLCLPTAKVRLHARSVVESIVAPAEKNANHCLRVVDFVADPANFPLYEQRYVDTAKHKVLRAGAFAVEGARQAAPFLSTPWAMGVRAADFVWNYGQYGLVGLLCSGEIMEGVKTLMNLSGSIQSIQPRDLIVGMVYLSADQRRQLRDEPEGARSQALAHGQPVPPDVLEALIGLAVLGMHGPYETDPFEAQRFALQQHWRLVTDRLGESWKHRPSWCLYIREEDRLAAVGIRGTDVEQSCGGDLFTDVNAVPARTVGVDGRVMVSHSGMLAAAKAIESELRPTFRALVASGYQIAISGHSLGAAVAALLVWLLHWGDDGECLPDSSGVFGIGYASPSAVDRKTAVDLQPCFTSVVNSMDIVPRLGLGTLKRLGTDIVACARQSAPDLDADVSHYIDRLSTLWAPRMREGVPTRASGSASSFAGESLEDFVAEGSKDGGECKSDLDLQVGCGRSMGFEVLLNVDPFPGSDSHSMPASDLDACKRTCRETGCGAFVVWQGTAYFRLQSPAECRRHLVTHAGSVTYVNCERESSSEGVAGASGASRDGEDLYVPGNVVWIHRVAGHLEAAVVPCDLPQLRRVTLDKRMFIDHKRLSYHTALHAVKARNDVAATAPKVRWQRFSDAGERCPCCGSVFEWMNTARSAKQRWHAMTNCRACGLVVCLGCASTQRALPDQGILAPARVCDRCVWRGPDEGAGLASMPQAFQRLAVGSSAGRAA